MKINLRIHNRNHIIKSILGNTEYLFTRLGLKNNELIVVNYHGTQKKFIPNFREQLNFFKKTFSIISPYDLPDFYEGKFNTSLKPLLLLTFDDGIKNNMYASEILKEYNIKAFFFVIPDFINSAIPQQKEYFLRYIRPQINSEIDDKEEDFTAMSWNDLKKLKSEGHYIGSHTQTHRLIAKQSSMENSIIEIERSKFNIAKGLNTSLESVNSFCSINNTLESISAKEIELIKANYEYNFTTIPGPNYSLSNKLYIKRANIESHWLLGAVEFAIGKWDLKRWMEADMKYAMLMK